MTDHDLEHEQEQEQQTPVVAAPATSPPSLASIRLRQVLVVSVGVIAAVAMVTLGLWQMQVYRDQSVQTSEDRAAAAPLPLSEVAGPGQAITDGFGRTVTFSGTYNPEFQVLVPVANEPAHFRVLSGMELDDGSVVPVVRGVVTGTDPPSAPAGRIKQSGILLPSEQSVDGAPSPPGQIPSVRLASLAQQWPKPLISGYVTLGPAEAKAQSLLPSVPDLPEGRGRLRNGAYAFQWWIFAAFAVAMSIRMARDFGDRKDYDDLLLTERVAKTSEAAGSSDGPPAGTPIS